MVPLIPKLAKLKLSVLAVVFWIFAVTITIALVVVAEPNVTETAVHPVNAEVYEVEVVVQPAVALLSVTGVFAIPAAPVEPVAPAGGRDKASSDRE